MRPFCGRFQCSGYLRNGLRYRSLRTALALDEPQVINEGDAAPPSLGGDKDSGDDIGYILGYAVARKVRLREGI